VPAYPRSLPYREPGTAISLSPASTSGKLCIVGYHQDGTREIRLGHWNWMALNIINAHFREQATVLSGMHKAIRLLRSDLIDLAPLITNVYALDRIAEALEAAAARPEGFVKAIIEPNSLESDHMTPSHL
jgi:threonine dehydrogenase-like Zn-dependent dehydrogenase